MTIYDRIANFVSYCSESNSYLEKAALEYVCALNEHTDKNYVKSEFMKKTKVSSNTLDVLESIGKNERDVRLLWQKTDVVKHLEKMSIDLQKVLLDDFCVEIYDGIDVRKKSLDMLSDDEWERIYSKEDGKLRDVNWQKAYVLNMQTSVKKSSIIKTNHAKSIQNKKNNVKTGKKGFSVSAVEKKVYVDVTRLVLVNGVLEMDYALIEKLYKAIH